MNVWQRHLIDQAKALRAKPRLPETLEQTLLALPWGFEIKGVCRKHGARLEYGNGYLPGTSCYACHTYIDRCLEKDLRSAEVHLRIESACLRNWESLHKSGRISINAA